MPGIDIHTHLAPALAGQLPDGVVRDDGRLVVDGGRIGLRALYEPEQLIVHLDDAGLDGAVVSAPPPFYRSQLGPAEAAAWVRALNDGIAAAVAAEPRLQSLAYLPLEHPEIALAELRRTAGGTHAGYTAAAGGRSRSLADPALEPLWRELDEAAAMLLLHPGASPDERMDDFYLGNLLGNPVETTLAAAQLVFGDVLPRFPRMRVVLVHGGGAVAALAGRWERGVATERPGLAPLSESPLTAIRRFYVDTVTHEPLLEALAVERFGAGRVVLGSDWPFPMGAYAPSEHPEAQRFAVQNAAAALGRDQLS